MKTTEQLRRELSCEKALSEAFKICAGGDTDAYRTRCLHVLDGFEAAFGSQNGVCLFSAPGRAELCGNHTDHENGIVFAAAVCDDIITAAAPGGHTIELISEGCDTVRIDPDQSAAEYTERGTTAALVRGVVDGFRKLGAEVSGFRAYLNSSVPVGSGLSSSAAFEVLLGVILNEFFFSRRASGLEIARIGQRAENEYYGKPSGMMDQLASATGGAVAIDFKNPSQPKVRQIGFDPECEGYRLCTLDSGAGHEALTSEYAAVTGEIKSVCAVFGKKTLRELPEAEFLAQLPRLRRITGDRAVLRCLHVYAENTRVTELIEAIEERDMERAMDLLTESGQSSYMYLQNVIPTGETRYQNAAAAIAVAELALEGRGAFRIHGGGFAGTVLCMVPMDMYGRFRDKVEAILGTGTCKPLKIRTLGGTSL